MPRVVFTQNLQRHVACPAVEVDARTVREALEAAFAANPRLRGYVVDEAGGLRQHMTVFVDGVQIADRRRQSDAVAPSSEIHVVQSLSGG